MPGLQRQVAISSRLINDMKTATSHVWSGSASEGRTGEVTGEGDRFLLHIPRPRRHERQISGAIADANSRSHAVMTHIRSGVRQAVPEKAWNTPMRPTAAQEWPCEHG